MQRMTIVIMNILMKEYMKSHRIIFIFLILIAMFILDLLSFVGYLLEIRDRIANIEHWTKIMGTMPFINIFIVFIAARVMLSWLLLKKLLEISGKIYIVFLSIPIITTEAIIRDIVFGIEKATEIINKEGIGAYTIFSKILFEKNLPETMVILLGILLCEASRVLLIYFIGKK